MFSFFKRRPPTPARPKNVAVPGLLAALQQLNPQHGLEVFAPHNSVVVISPSYKTIPEYNNLLKTLCRIKDDVDLLNRQYMGPANSPILLREWFVDTQGQSVDPVDELETFQHYGSELQAFFERQDLSTNNGIYTRRLLNNKIVELSVLTTVINKTINPPPAVKVFDGVL